METYIIASIITTILGNIAQLIVNYYKEFISAPLIFKGFLYLTIYILQFVVIGATYIIYSIPPSDLVSLAIIPILSAGLHFTIDEDLLFILNKIASLGIVIIMTLIFYGVWYILLR